MPDRSAASYASWTPDNRLWASVVRLKAGRLAWVRTGTDGCRGGACEEGGDEEGAYIEGCPESS